MATDITIEAVETRAAVSFADFAANSAPLIATAAVLATGHHASAEERLAVLLEQCHKQWGELGYEHDPDVWFFAEAIRSLPQGSETLTCLQPMSREQRAAVVAQSLLQWPGDLLAQALGVREHQGDELFAQAVVHLSAVEGTNETDLGEEILAGAAAINVSLPAAGEVVAKRRRAVAQSRLAVALVALASLALGGSFVANAASSTERSPRVEPAALAAPVEAATPEADQPSDPMIEDDSDDSGLTEAVLAGSQVPAPRFITVDGSGAFAGASMPIDAVPTEPRLAVMSTSIDGQAWTFAGRWPLAAGEEIHRFERVGERYVAWVERIRSTEPAEFLKIGTSANLTEWVAYQVPVETAPDGLFFRPSISDVAVSAGNVVVLLTTHVELDYGAFALVESATCGSHISELGVVVDLCNGGEFQAMTSEEVGELPPLHQLLVSRAGSRFVPVQAPFGPDTAVGLTSTNGQFGITKRDGQWFATSTNGVQWSATGGATRTPPLVRASATNADGSIVGISVGGAGPSLLFRAQDQNTQVIAVSDVIGQEPRSFSATVESGPAGWIVDLAQDNGDSWLIYSNDGVVWRLLESPTPVGVERRVYVGDDELLVKVLVGTNDVIIRVPLEMTSDVVDNDG